MNKIKKIIFDIECDIDQRTSKYIMGLAILFVISIIL
jgi:hypothetical protein|tara:strand:+ start:996 stop:1106 length:111 start_codon:yes stop_codon:yes gene_type:complete